MQYLTAIAIIFIALSFAAIVIVDFISGLVDIWEKAGTGTQPRVEAKPAIEQPAIANQVEPALALADLWMQPVEEVAMVAARTAVDIARTDEQPSVKSQLLLAPAQVQVATLEWTLNNLPRIETFIVEMPCAIALAKSKLPSSTPAVQLATRQQLIDSGIRRCKKLASKLKIRRYNVMKLSELADNLQGLVAASDLISDSEVLA